MALPLTEKLAALLQDGTMQTRAALITQDLAENMLEAGQGGIADAVWAKRRDLCLDIINNRLNQRQLLQSVLMEDTVRTLVGATADDAGVVGWRGAIGDTALRNVLVSRLQRFASLR